MINRVPFDGAGYLDVGQLMAHVLPFTWIWGGRGTGKTYGFLKYVRYDHPMKFLILRRTQKQIDLIKKPAFNPFRPVDQDQGGLTVCRRDGELGVFYAGQLDGDTVQPAGLPLGYAVALSTIHNIRGIDLSDVEIIIYDEYIPEQHERPIQDEYLAFLNAMETIGRNRELQGRPPIQFIGLSNSNSLGNPYFVGLQVIRIVDRMLQRQQEIWQDPDRGLMLVNIIRSPVSLAKAGTSLYRLAGSGEFADMSLGNEFSQDYCSRQGSIPLQECDPLVTVGEITVYEHKRKRDCLYCCDHRSGNPPRYQADETSIKRFRRDYWYLQQDYMDQLFTFQDIMCEVLFKRYIGI